jgi:hypothetical protein
MDQSSVSQAVTLVVQILMPVIAVLGTWFAHRVIKTFEMKTGIDVPAKQEAQIDSWVESGIRFAEEKAHQAAQRAAGTAKLAGHEKLEHAASFIMGMVEKNGWDDWARDTIKAKVEARLNVTKEREGSPAGQ